MVLTDERVVATPTTESRKSVEEVGIGHPARTQTMTTTTWPSRRQPRRATAAA